MGAGKWGNGSKAPGRNVLERAARELTSNVWCDSLDRGYSATASEITPSAVNVEVLRTARSAVAVQTRLHVYKYSKTGFIII